MEQVGQAVRMNNVHYAIRGPLLDAAQKLDRPHACQQSPWLVYSAEIAENHIEQLDHTQLVFAVIG